jgi:hypothetical protein
MYNALNVKIIKEDDLVYILLSDSYDKTYFAVPKREYVPSVEWVKKQISKLPEFENVMDGVSDFYFEGLV